MSRISSGSSLFTKVSYLGVSPSTKVKELHVNDEITYKLQVHTVCIVYEPRHEIPNNMVCATSKGSNQPVHMHSQIRAFASRLNII